MNKNKPGDGDGESAFPEVGAGSAEWLRKFRDSQVAASAIAGFLGGFLGKFTRRGPTFSWGDRGSLIVQTSDGVMVVLDDDAVLHLRRAIRGVVEWYHLGSSDEDLPTG